MRSEADAIFSVQRFFAGVLDEPWDVRTDLEGGDPPDRPFAVIEQAAAGEAPSAGPTIQEVVLPLVANLYLEKRDTREQADAAALVVRELVWRSVKWGPDLRRPTTDRIPLYCYEPREEWHRFGVPALVSSFQITVAGHQTASLSPADSAAQVAAAIETAFGSAAEPGDISGHDRGEGLWDIAYGGSLAGQRIGDPAITAGAGARVLLQGAPAPWRGPSDYMRVQSFSQNTIRDAADPTLVMVAADLRLTFARGLPLPLDMRILQRVSATVGSGPGG